jgi:hypothetical protein
MSTIEKDVNIPEGRLAEVVREREAELAELKARMGGGASADPAA